MNCRRGASPMRHFREFIIFDKKVNSILSLLIGPTARRTDSFQEGGNNERVQKRLEMVLKYYKEYHQGNPAIFTRLADCAYCMVPPVPF